MNITLDKALTEKEKTSRTKKQMKEFKQMYTDGDLLRMFRTAVQDETLGYCCPVIKCDLAAFPGGYMETDETHYSVNMLLEGWKEFIRIRFFITQSGDVDTRTDLPFYGPNGIEHMAMYSVQHYRET